VLGELASAEVVDEIERVLDDPNSEVSRMATEYARLSRIVCDPNGPRLGDRWTMRRRREREMERSGEGSGRSN